MASGLIRGFHLLLAGLLAGAGVGVIISCGVVFQHFADERVTALAISDRIFELFDPLRTAATLALIASSFALMLRSRAAAASVRLVLVVVLLALQGWHVFGIKPALRSSPSQVVAADTQPAADFAATARADATTLRLYRRMFMVLLGQCFLAAMLLVSEAMSQPLSRDEIAAGWRKALRRREAAGSER